MRCTAPSQRHLYLTLLLGCLAATGPTAAQTAGLSCFQCPGATTLDAWTCPVNEFIEIGNGCIGFNNCQKPETTQHGVEIVETSPGISQARLVVEVKARWNSKAEAGPNSKLDMFWNTGGTATHPTDDLCEHNTTDRVYTILLFSGLTCDGAPYSLGTYSLRAVVCDSPDCLQISDEVGMVVEVTKQTLGCPDPPKDDCEECISCPLPGVPADGRGPRIGGGELGAGGGAYLYYAAGGVGHPQYPGTAEHSVALGRYWMHDYARRIVVDPDESHVWLLTRKGVFREWGSPDFSGVYQTVSPSSEKRTLTWLGAGAGWELRELDGVVHSFDDLGRWTASTPPEGPTVATTGMYTGNQLVSVEFPDQRREDFAYYPAGDPSEGKLHTITEVGIDNLTTRTWEYVWSGDDLVRVNRPDGTALVFTYGDPALPGYLTRIELEGTDDTSLRVVRGYEYSPEGRLTKTWRGDASPTGPNAVDLWLLGLNDPVDPTVATVTPPTGDPITYTLGRDDDSTNVKVLSISGDCPTCGLGPNSQLSYDDAANPMLPTTVVDGRGIVTGWAYDVFGQVTSRTEAEGDPQLQRITSFGYSPTYPGILTSISQPSVAGGAALRETVWTLDASGNVTHREVFGFEGGSALPPLVTEITPNAQGQPVMIDPPGFGTDDLTELTYDPGRGHLVADTRTDPLVGTTTFGHDSFNRRTSVTDPNELVTKTSYDSLDRVTEVRQEGVSSPTGDLVTTYEYTVFRELFRTFLPAGNVIEYGYDPAGRLISVERKPDAATHGERVFYTLDAAGNRTLEELQRWDDGASAWVTFSSTEYEYTNRCQVDRIVQAPETPEEAVTEFSYDCNGNLESQWDPNHDPATDPPTTSYGYDALDRLTSVSQPWAGGGLATTSYSYDVQDHLTSVTDAEGNVTEYTYSDRDLLTYEISEAFIDPAATCNPAPACDPGCGCTAHGYNEHGALTTTTHARGVTVTRDVDELDRVILVDYPGSDLDISYAYDSQPPVCAGASFPVGRLGSITRDGQAIEYCYDRFGRTTRDGELTYTWDDNGNRTQIVYPGGVEATYTHDFADREVTLEVTTPGGGAVAEPVVEAASYLPSGPLSTLLLGSGTTETRAFDGRYVPTSIALTGPVEKTFTYTTDEVGNILEIVEQAGCEPGPLLLENQTVTTEELFASCTTIEAGNGFAIESPGDVTFHAQGPIALKDGFAVGTGARFVAGSGALPELSRRSYGYQAPQYFLTRADGPWGTIDWSYDKIGNRLTESRDEGATIDGYAYATNGSGGNTPILDLVNLGVGGTRNYTWGAAGHLEEVAAGANVLDFDADAEGRLSGVDRTAAGETASFGYDGRSFLRRAEEAAGGTSSVEPLYDSAGLVHALRRRPAPADPEELVVFFYLAGRPVGQVAIDGAGAENWTYITPDHLGTPLLATDEVGVATWEGGLEPFGRDHQEGTPAGAIESNLYLRFGNEWMDEVWQNASSGVPLQIGFDRWQSTGSARYLRPMPEVYFLTATAVSEGLFGPPASVPSTVFAVAGEPLQPRGSVLHPASIAASVFARMVCDGCGGFKWIWVSEQRPVCATKCFVMHEEDHVDWFEINRPKACEDRGDGDNPITQPGDKARTECRAYGVSYTCLENERRLAKATGKTQECQSFLNNNARLHRNQRNAFCQNGE